MTFILLSNGEEYALAGLHPTPPIEVIAHSLSQINRYTGHTSRPYSVAEHSLLVAHIAAVRYSASPALQMACLLHDAHECVTGDVASPVKACLGEAWSTFERRIARQFRRDLGLLTTFGAQGHLVHHCDLIALASERHALMPYNPAAHSPWPILDTEGREVLPFEGYDFEGPIRHPVEWRLDFGDEYDRLATAIKAQFAAMSASAAPEAGS